MTDLSHRPPRPGLPAFEEAADCMGAFLVSRGHPARIIWIFREDVVLHNRAFAIRDGLPDENPQLAKALYSLARRRGLGLELRALCRLDDATCCHLWIPNEQGDAEYAMLSPDHVKMTIPTAIPRAKRIAGAPPALWTEEGGGSLIDEIPNRQLVRARIAAEADLMTEER